MQRRREHCPFCQAGLLDRAMDREQAGVCPACGAAFPETVPDGMEEIDLRAFARMPAPGTIYLGRPIVGEGDHLIGSTRLKIGETSAAFLMETDDRTAALWTVPASLRELARTGRTVEFVALLPGGPPLGGSLRVRHVLTSRRNNRILVGATFDALAPGADRVLGDHLAMGPSVALPPAAGSPEGRPLPGGWRVRLHHALSHRFTEGIMRLLPPDSMDPVTLLTRVIFHVGAAIERFGEELLAIRASGAVHGADSGPPREMARLGGRITLAVLQGLVRDGVAPRPLLFAGAGHLVRVADSALYEFVAPRAGTPEPGPPGA